ncbi:MAG: hypothetical protein GOMPHAMPRED_005164 [Gomphillus americanus]|uniref:2-(3-amino-3-carboxypropyl)histidine synthase subunit 2 n=1 Tax=Gomphillus americanus TaxID=1940652 RepID=A0A8H3IR87_9LECA|nr:MAG: hypothetical protein GOMPHAMPRED_005164 [Gomphillus americanus]
MQTTNGHDITTTEPSNYPMAESTTPSTAPILSTPDDNILLHPAPIIPSTASEQLSDADVITRYEISRTASELVVGGWLCIALQFPDSLLEHAVRVVELLKRELDKTPLKSSATNKPDSLDLGASMNDVSLVDRPGVRPPSRRLYILGDTSFGACCVDEIAAEHISAEVVVHYGRACLSPTARLPVIHVFTKKPLDHDTVVDMFVKTYPSKEAKVILMADTMFHNHIPTLYARLRDEKAYSNIYAPEIIHNPSSLLPNRTLPAHCQDNAVELKSYALFHISTPPTALLLTLSSRIGDIKIYLTDNTISTPIQASTTALLRRRYGLLTSLSTARIFGILINTLSISSYQHAAAKIAAQIASAGRKSYTFVVGKINAAKVANFAEVDGWVVVGCWESSLVEGDGFWKPIITPFELEIVLKGDNSRVWTGEWRGGFDDEQQRQQQSGDARQGSGSSNAGVQIDQEDGYDESEDDDDDESAPPEFDLRTGRYVSYSKPRSGQARRDKTLQSGRSTATSLVARNKGEMAVIGNEISPGAEFLRTQRTWRGLGSDIQIEYEEDGQEADTLMEEGRSGIARGYGNEASR